MHNHTLNMRKESMKKRAIIGDRKPIFGDRKAIFGDDRSIDVV